MPALVEKLLDECDPDLKAFLLGSSDVKIVNSDDDTPANRYMRWQLIQNPVQAILDWQRMRDQRPTKKI